MEGISKENNCEVFYCYPNNTDIRPRSVMLLPAVTVNGESTWYQEDEY